MEGGESDRDAVDVRLRRTCMIMYCMRSRRYDLHGLYDVGEAYKHILYDVGLLAISGVVALDVAFMLLLFMQCLESTIQYN